MRRTVEILSALGATMVGLIGVGSEVRAVENPYFNAQLSIIPMAMVGPHRWALMSAQVLHFTLLLALLLAGVSIGAYLHATRNSVGGLAILWVSTVSLIGAVGFIAIAPPSFAYTGGSISALTLDVVPTAMHVVAVMLAGVAAMATITPAASGEPGTANVWLNPLRRVLGFGIAGASQPPGAHDIR